MPGVVFAIIIIGAAFVILLHDHLHGVGRS